MKQKLREQLQFISCSYHHYILNSSPSKRPRQHNNRGTAILQLIGVFVLSSIRGVSVNNYASTDAALGQIQLFISRQEWWITSILAKTRTFCPSRYSCLLKGMVFCYNDKCKEKMLQWQKQQIDDRKRNDMISKSQNYLLLRTSKETIFSQRASKSSRCGVMRLLSQ